MPSFPLNYTKQYNDLLTTTLEYMSPTMQDALTKSAALWYTLKKKNRFKGLSGGEHITEFIKYGANTNVKWFNPYEELSTNQVDGMTPIKYPWRSLAVAVPISTQEMLQNGNDKERVFNLLDKKLEIAEDSLMNELASTALYYNGTENNGKSIYGLSYFFPKDPTTGTVGNISRATYSFVRSRKFAIVDDGSVATSATNIQPRVNKIYFSAKRGKKGPDLILAGLNKWLLQLASLQAIQRITNDNLGQFGFDNIRYMGADIVFGGGQGEGCDPDDMWFLDTSGLTFHYHKDMFMNKMDLGQPYKQAAIVNCIGVYGNMTCSLFDTTTRFFES